jgi:hypothetical protein
MPWKKPFETVFLSASPPAAALKRGVNEKISTAYVERRKILVDHFALGVIVRK